MDPPQEDTWAARTITPADKLYWHTVKNLPADMDAKAKAYLEQLPHPNFDFLNKAMEEYAIKASEQTAAPQSVSQGGLLSYLSMENLQRLAAH